MEPLYSLLKKGSESYRIYGKLLKDDVQKKSIKNKV
ncbi:hypothetical protein Q783_06525 [Carnobacterium inhibens subsp. gilichinskyi]|uniref:Uncharacterized protein n=1 Tax=Carnobacterium inhibens subsp. gilichinskyi TaxID=1266845 RepID=U5SC43_9LACT|nr:hypothetical protein Q783_06525 [Carnobacterium inhibens subsp. gilichinskyi]